MTNYIPVDKLKAEIESRMEDCKLPDGTFPTTTSIVRYEELSCLRNLITSLQQEPRFPQYDNIVDKVFGAGNLEGFEYREAEMLVALAKEELLKSLQQEQPKPSEYDKGLLEVKRMVDKLYDEASIGLSEYDSGLYNGITETCMKLRGFIKARLDSDEQPEVNLVAELKHHLATTPKEQLEKEWKELEPWGNIGPTVQEFLYGKQPKADLEQFDKDVTEIWGRCAAEPNDSIACLHIETFIKVARHFWNKGYNARKEE